MIPGIVASQNVSGGGGGDPYFADVSLLLHMDGANASTTFTDSSALARAMTAVGNAQISTAQSKFGGASGLFDGTGDQVTTPNVSAFRFGTADYTIEFWVRPANLSDFRHLIQTCDFESNQLSVRTTSTGTVQVFFNNGSNALGILTTSASISALTWTHVAVSRVSGTTRVFLNGVQRASSAAAYNVTGSTGPLRIASRNDISTLQFVGNLDDLRITTGVGRYASDFTPPSAAFPDS